MHALLLMHKYTHLVESCLWTLLMSSLLLYSHLNWGWLKKLYTSSLILSTRKNCTPHESNNEACSHNTSHTHPSTLPHQSELPPLHDYQPDPGGIPPPCSQQWLQPPLPPAGRLQQHDHENWHSEEESNPYYSYCWDQAVPMWWNEISIIHC